MQFVRHVRRYGRGRHQLARHGIVTTTVLATVAAAVGALLMSASASAAGANDPVGYFDRASATSKATIVVSGWAYDPNSPKTSLAVDIDIDAHRSVVHTSIARPDVVKAYPNAGPNTGFSLTSGVLAWGTHKACVTVVNIGSGANLSLGCRLVTLVDPHNPRGSMAIAVHGNAVTVSGYAYDVDTAGAIHVQTSVDGGAWQDHLASATTPTAPVSGAHGYTSSWTLTHANHRICVTAINVGLGSGNTSLGCKTAALLTLNEQIAAYAKTFVGKYPYRDGGASPSTGFDCSGLSLYVYAHYNKAIPRTADQQYHAFRNIALSSAQPGDLVFFHDNSGYVYHVGIFEGGGMMVAAATPADGIRYQTVWSSAVTYGTITH